MSSASSAVTYTFVYTNSKPGRVFWGADEELSDGDSLRVIVYGYDGLPMLPVAPPSLDYVPSPKEPQTPPVPQNKDEHEPMFIQPHDLDFMLEPIYPEYIPLEDKHVLLAEEHPLPHVVSPTAESPEYVDESDPEEDPKECEDDETEDGPVNYPMDGGDDGDDDDAPADSAVVISTDELVSPPEETEPVMPPPSTDTTTTGARITVQFQAAISFPPKAERVDLLMKDRIAYQETIQIVEEEAYDVREAWAHSIGLNKAVHSELQTHQEQMQQTEIAELRETDRRHQAQMVETLRVMGGMRREMGEMQRNNGENPKGNGCFECGSLGYFKMDCPKLKNKDRGKVNAPGWVYAVGNAEKRGNASRDPDSNVITGTFLLNNRYASILFDTGDDRSFISTAFSSLIDVVPTLLGNNYDVGLADGKRVGVDTIMRGYTLNFLSHPFNIDLMQVELGSFNVIIGDVTP
nr:putative reverse transcriptase domain-containing protein [Tanacetum cinerariifolium]